MTAGVAEPTAVSWDDLRCCTSIRQPVKITIMDVPAMLIPVRSGIGFYVVNDINIWRTSERLELFKRWVDARLVKLA